ncbi:peptide chain release factor 1 [Sorangium cellulosum]|uniref:Peptide chain release factor 1 n=2 Tax=Sorangium cellulosum TaxID=56 RepID=A0A150PL04_SORCE|nr:peptide chain release factor 1 [Sorangium cellulosum]AGP32998.1 peptide chain release factor 1 [Sorangium cellulosum So0157-2]KYF56365.1 peptide chain release factor 1 [Sorangium cellulosum]KYG08471.1 peptide chain release factor 1 [Sorangium cellulosum]
MLPIAKLEAVQRRFQELEHLMCSPAVLSSPAELQRLNRERTEIEPVVVAFARLRDVERRIAEDREALSDPDLSELAQAELPELETERERLASELELLLLPKDPNDARNTVIEIRSGEGGEEAALFAADLFRMLCRYAETKRWKVEVLNLSEASAGGYKEVAALISGQDVYSHLRYEGGVHRVQRVPTTETQGRIHTSTATVAVLPEADEVDVHIDDKDLEISIAASGGPGGQGVNTTNSAVQIKHLPTGMIVKCQDERSQLKNKAKAMKVLRSRLLEIEQRRQEEAQSAERRTMVGTGERAQKVRTYNFPQNRVTDHRIGLTLHKLDKIIEGDLDELIGALRTHRQAELLRRGGLSGPAGGAVEPLT